jgi:hypothetical protein
VNMQHGLNIPSGGVSAFQHPVKKTDSERLVEALDASELFVSITKEKNDVVRKIHDYEVQNLKDETKRATAVADARLGMVKMEHNATKSTLMSEVESLKMANATSETTIEHKNHMLKRKDAEIALMEETYQTQKKICLSLRTAGKDNDMMKAKNNGMMKAKDDTIARMEVDHTNMASSLRSCVDTYKSLYKNKKAVLKTKNEVIDNLSEAYDTQKKIIKSLKTTLIQLARQDSDE